MSENRGKFENAWKNALEGKEVSPPTSVWDGISDAMKKDKEAKLFILPKMLAAASIFIALSVGVYYGIIIENSGKGEHSAGNDSPISANRQDENFSSEERASSDNSQRDATTRSGHSQEPDVSTDNSVNDFDEPLLTDKGDQGESPVVTQQYILSNKSEIAEDTRISSRKNDLQPADVISSDESNGDVLAENLSQGEQIAFLNNIGPKGPEWELDFVEIYAVNQGYDLIEEDHSRKETVFLAGLNYSTGVFSPNSGSQSSSNADAIAPASNSSMLSLNSLEAPGFGAKQASVISDFRVDREDDYQQSAAVSYGANFGVHLTDRLILFSGLNYTKAYSDLNAGVSVTETQNVLSDNFYGITESREKVVNEYEYVIENQFEFASIPLKAGYAVINKQFSLTLMTGISTDILLNVDRKSDDAESRHLDLAVEETTGEDFNSVYFNGLLGVSAGYLIDGHYFIYVEPSYRRAINSFFIEDDSRGMANFKMMTFGLSYRFH